MSGWSPIIGVFASAGASSGGGTPAVDPHWSNVSLLCGFNNSFDDESDYARTPTLTEGWDLDANGKFDGCISRAAGALNTQIVFAHDAGFDLGGDPYTFEAWVQVDGSSDEAFIITQGPDDNINDAFYFAIVNGKPRFWTSDDGTGWNVELDSPTQLNLSTWHHVAADYDGTTVRLYLDGVVVDSVSYSGSVYSPVATPKIGDYQGSKSSGGAKIDELRVTKGVARYAGAFTPPTAAFPRQGSGDVLLLLGFDSGLDDESTYARVVKENNSIVQDSDAYFGSSAIKATAATYNKGLSFEEDAAFAFPGKFTVEGFVKTAGAGDDISIVMYGLAGSSNDSWSLRVNNGDVRFDYDLDSGGAGNLTASNVLTTGTWHHVAVTRDSNDLVTIWVDGVSEASATISGAFRVAGEDIWVHRYSNSSGGASNALLDEVRVTKDVAHYTSAFTPPAAAFPRPSSVTADILLPFDTGTESNNEGTLGQPTEHGSPVYISSAKFGGGLAGGAFSNYLSFSQSALNFNGKEWTIEFWAMKDGNANPRFLSMWETGDLVLRTKGATSGWTFQWGLSSSGFSESTIDGGTFVSGTWHHFALTRDSGGLVRAFQDGVLIESLTIDLHNVGADVSPMAICGSGCGGNAHLDDLRIELGVCHYTSAFTPPGEHTT